MSQATFLEVEKKRAVLAGINKYHDSSIRSLQYSVADVGSVYDLLIDSTRGGFNNVDVRLMVDDSQNIDVPNRSNLMSAVKSLTETASGRDVILFFFSGHGIEQNRKSYLLSSDSRINVLDETAVPIEWIKDHMIKSNARAKILILDACHAGALIGKSESGRMTKEFGETIFSPPEGFAVLSSCKINEVSYEWTDKSHGVFTYYLTQGLLGSADFDSDSSVTVSELSRYVSEQVKSWAFSNGVQQSPTLEYRVSGDIILANIPQPVRKSKPALLRGKNPKEYVERIVLRTSKEPIGVGELCAHLLSYYKPQEIVPIENSRDYMFPDGQLNRRFSQTVVSVFFKYNPKSWDLVDKMIQDLEHAFYWSQVSFEIKAKFDAEKLITLCKNSKISIDDWLPDEPLELEASAEGWGREGRSAKVHFKNVEGNGSSLDITQFNQAGQRDLEDTFYTKLNPEKIVGFLKSCLVDLNPKELEEYKKRLA